MSGGLFVVGPSFRFGGNWSPSRVECHFSRLPSSTENDPLELAISSELYLLSACRRSALAPLYAMRNMPYTVSIFNSVQEQFKLMRRDLEVKGRLPGLGSWVVLEFSLLHQKEIISWRLLGGNLTHRIPQKL